MLDKAEFTGELIISYYYQTKLSTSIYICIVGGQPNPAGKSSQEELEMDGFDHAVSISEDR
jgi:hypothetical protein